jgi:hypothetical protein
MHACPVDDAVQVSHRLDGCGRRLHLALSSRHLFDEEVIGHCLDVHPHDRALDALRQTIEGWPFVHVSPYGRSGVGRPSLTTGRYSHRRHGFTTDAVALRVTVFHYPKTAYRREMAALVVKAANDTGVDRVCSVASRIRLCRGGRVC